MDEQPEVIETQQGKRDYIVKVGGGFIIRVKAKSRDYAEGIATGQVTAQLPRFIVSSVVVEDAPEE